MSVCVQSCHQNKWLIQLFYNLFFFRPLGNCEYGSKRFVGHHTEYWRRVYHFSDKRYADFAAYNPVSELRRKTRPFDDVGLADLEEVEALWRYC